MSMATVLVVDDDAQSLQLIELILRRDQHTVFTSAQSTAAVDLIYAHQPDVVILNDNMPYVSGGEVCRQIKHDPQIGSTPVILSSAGVRVRDPDYVRDTCADAVLLKPCLPADVRSLVNRCLNAGT
jgi:two-component system sensor histidine kinase/response regulator